MAAARNDTPPRTKGRPPWLLLWLALAFALLAWFVGPTLILLFFGMLPTVVAFIIDRTPQRYSSYCVGGINFCGVFPFILELWAGDHTATAAVTILTDVFRLLLMYGAAGLGWMIYMAIPPVVSAFLRVNDQHKVAQLRKTQQDLIEEWGDDVATSREGSGKSEDQPQGKPARA